MGWIEGARTRLRLLFDRQSAESRMREEIRFHVEMETERIMRATGVDRAEARRLAYIAFGGVERYKEELRDGRGLAWLGSLSLDFKLGLRMLAKYPGLSIVGVVGLAVAVTIGTVSFGIIFTIFDPAVPLDEGARVVSIREMDGRRPGAGELLHLHDLSEWREGVTAVEAFGAYRNARRNLITPEAPPEPVRIAEMTASGFRIARVPPLLGRYFNEDDEREGAPPVVVIGYSLWQGRFASDPTVIGRTLRLGNTPHSIIGVMPRGFAFPVNNRVWTPLRLDPSDYARGEAPPINVFGRLAAGASLEDARTQLATVGKRLAAAYPELYADVRTRVVPYARAFTDAPESGWMFYLVHLGVTMLLVVIGTNVAILVYARTASRTGEIAVRSALGASRGRIVGQLFAEALVMSLVASAAGLAMGWVALSQVNAFIDRTGPEQVPFWMRFSLSPGMVLNTVGLAVLGAVIIGVLPGLKATRRQLHATLQQGSARTAMRLGKGWTAMIVVQVAMAVAVLPLAIAGIALVIKQELAKPAVPPGEWVTATVVLDREAPFSVEPPGFDPAFRARFAVLQSELLGRVRSEPGVVSAVLASGVPGEESDGRVEVEEASDAAAAGKVDSAASAASATGRAAAFVNVDADYFRAFDVPLLAGRTFQASDMDTAATAVVVNRSFVQKAFGGGSALGRRVRQPSTQRVVAGREPEATPPGPWLEIVGVVSDFPNPVNPRFPEARVYRPLVPGVEPAVTLAVRVRGGAAPAELGARLRNVALAVDPMLRLPDVTPLDESLEDRKLELRVAVLVVVLVTLAVLLLSAAGIYALMSFTITKRRQEIGIRAALGATPRQVIGPVLRRAMAQIAVGIVVGLSVAGFLDSRMNGGFTGGRGIYYLVGIAAFMLAVGSLAAIAPARRALRIPPTEALKAE